MSSRRVPGKGVVVADVHLKSRSTAQKKKGTSRFLYLIPVLPVIFMLVMSGKSENDASDSSFLVPQSQKETPRLRAVETEQQHAAAVAQALPQDNSAEVATAAVQQQQQQPPPPPPGALANAETSKAAGNMAQLKPPANAETSSSASSSFQILKKADLITSPNTVVTAYVTLRSKFAKEEYLKWMSTMLSLQDAMVIFTSPELVETMQSFRAHATNRTVVIPIQLDQLELVQRYDTAFWEDQLEKDIEKRVHRSYELFWIWLSKSFFIKTAIDLNVYQSDVFMWSDIGCFRNGQYQGSTMIEHREVIPTDRVLQMAHHQPQLPPYVWWNDKYKQVRYFYHSGSQMVAYKDTWLAFHTAFLETIEGFIQRGMFIGEDQTVAQSTCLRIPTLCAYVPEAQVKDNHYFGLRRVVRFGGKYDYWYPPPVGTIPLELADVTNKTTLKPAVYDKK